MKINERNLRFNRRLMVFTVCSGFIVAIAAASLIPLFTHPVLRVLDILVPAFVIHAILFNKLKRDKYGK